MISDERCLDEGPVRGLDVRGGKCLLALETVGAGADHGLVVGTAVDAGAIAEHLGVGAAQAHRPFGAVAAQQKEAGWYGTKVYILAARETGAPSTTSHQR